MKIISKTFISAALPIILALLFFSPLVTLAVGGGNTGGNQLPDVGIHNPQDVVNIAKGIVVWVYQIFFIVAVGFILWAAFLYLTAKDDAAKVTKAKASLKNAVIAIVIALVASGASALIENAITGLK